MPVQFRCIFDNARYVGSKNDVYTKAAIAAPADGLIVYDTTLKEALLQLLYFHLEHDSW
jgi:hypothetical protein